MTAKILIVDDIASNRKVLEANLNAEYFEVSTSSSGTEALEVIERSPPDLILLDVMMPDMSGYDVCTRLKSDHRYSHIPIVMVTALDSAQDMVRGLECGADDFLTKPLNNLALFARVRSLVRLKRILDEWRLREDGPLGDLSRDALADEPYTDARAFLMSNNEGVRKVIHETAEALGHDVVQCTDGTSPTRQLLSESFDLILADTGYQQFDALRLCSLARSQDATRHLPFVLIGARGDSERLYRGLELGANECVIRPLNPYEVMARLKTQIRRHRLQQRIQLRHKANLNHAVTDALTGLYNRYYLETHMPRLHTRAVKERRPLSIVFCDLDHFKTINDMHGHAVGDAVLQHVAGILADGVRPPDLVVRYGGEEFVIALPDTGLDEAHFVADRLRRIIAASEIPLHTTKSKLRVTASFGVADLAWDEPSTDDAMRRADEALYGSKHRGRNCVSKASPKLYPFGGSPTLQAIGPA
jgi:two-component system cell cycle response regulator